MLEHKVVFTPAQDKFDTSPNSGVRDVDVIFLVVGDKGIVEFQLGSGWYLPATQDRREKWAKEHWWDHKQLAKDSRRLAFPTDVCYWSLVRMSEDDVEMVGIPRAFGGGVCFYGYKSSPAPEEAYLALLERGDAGVWDYLDAYYCEVFGC